ncbi:hypothetical protein BH09MYX1_BH09MYX1_53730 [soil metagenome]
MTTLAAATWGEIEGVRKTFAEQCSSVQVGAQLFADSLRRDFPSIVLGRVFLVLPFAKLSAADQAIARRESANDPRVIDSTSILTLLGTSGVEAAWCSRTTSAGHRVIPLIDETQVRRAPMITALLSHFDVDLKRLGTTGGIAPKAMLGGLNGKFFVPDAITAKDDAGRHVIPSREFVERYKVRSVFGMGGSYVDRTLVAAVFFTSELLTELEVSKFPSLISAVKMATADAYAHTAIYES